MMAQLGYEKLDDIIGRTDLLRPRDISLLKTQHLDLSYILSVCIDNIYPLSCATYSYMIANSNNVRNTLFSCVSVSRMLDYQS